MIIFDEIYALYSYDSEIKQKLVAAIEKKFKYYKEVDKEVKWQVVKENTGLSLTKLNKLLRFIKKFAKDNDYSIQSITLLFKEPAVIEVEYYDDKHKDKKMEFLMAPLYIMR